MNPTNQSSSLENSALQDTRSSHSENLVEHYWGSINYVTSLIKASELKAGLILSFYGILFNLIYQGTFELIANAGNNTILFILVGLWVGITVASVFFCVRCFIPKIEGKFKSNVFFFGDVISKFGEVEQFSKTFYRVSLNENELFDQLGEQIFVISKIATWKFKNVQRAILLLAIGLTLLLILAGFYGLVVLT
jgi:hypothetical protein